MDKDQILKRIIEVVNMTAPDSEMILYGSRARGESKRGSDWDLLILLNSDHISFDMETLFMDEFFELEIETGEVFSPLFYTKNDWFVNHKITPLYENILKDGVKLK
jgi:predicted nucleotidyltransferase